MYIYIYTLPVNQLLIWLLNLPVYHLGRVVAALPKNGSAGTLTPLQYGLTVNLITKQVNSDAVYEGPDNSIVVLTGEALGG